MYIYIYIHTNMYGPKYNDLICREPPLLVYNNMYGP